MTLPALNHLALTPSFADAIVGMTDNLATNKNATDATQGPGGQGALGSVLAAWRNILQSGAFGLSIPVVNKTGSAIAKGKLLAIQGYDTTTGRFLVVLADKSDADTAAVAVATTAIADNATAEVSNSLLVDGIGPNTSGASLGVPLYLSTSGAFTLTKPTSGVVQTCGVVQVKGNPGTVRVWIRPPTVPAVDAIVASVPQTYVGETPSFGAADTSKTLSVGAKYDGKQVVCVPSQADNGAATFASGVVSGGTCTVTANAAPGSGKTAKFAVIIAPAA